MLQFAASYQLPPAVFVQESVHPAASAEDGASAAATVAVSAASSSRAEEPPSAEGRPSHRARTRERFVAACTRTRLPCMIAPQALCRRRPHRAPKPDPPSRASTEVVAARLYQLLAGRVIPAGAYRAGLVSALPFSAELANDEAVLRFPYDERLRQLLRAIPGRRWDPVGRAWCIPLGPEQAEALARLLGGLRGPRRRSATSSRARSRAGARAASAGSVSSSCAAPMSDWWLSFATDAAPEIVAELLEHPEARTLRERSAARWFRSTSARPRCSRRSTRSDAAGARQRATRAHALEDLARERRAAARLTWPSARAAATTSSSAATVAASTGS